MDARFDIELELRAVNRDSEEEMTHTIHIVNDVDYRGLVAVQGLLLGVLAEMHKWGQARVAALDAPVAEAAAE